MEKDFGGCWCVMLQKRLLSDSEANDSEKKDARKKDGMVFDFVICYMFNLLLRYIKF